MRASRALGMALLCGALAAPAPASADGFPVEKGRYVGGPATVLDLDPAQKASIDRERMLVLTAAQQERLVREAGTRARAFRVYDLRLDESGCTFQAANLAFRFSEDQVEVAHLYLRADAEASGPRAALAAE